MGHAVLVVRANVARRLADDIQILQSLGADIQALAHGDVAAQSPQVLHITLD